MTRVPPNSVEAEQSVLGGIMLSSSAYDRVSTKVTRLDFYRNDHQIIFESIELLAADNKPCDVVTVSEHIESVGKINSVGGLPYLVSLVEDTPSAANIEAYADIVKEKSILRALIDASTEIQSLAYSHPSNEQVSSLTSKAERLIYDAGRLQSSDSPGPDAQLKELFEDVTARYEGTKEIGLMTCFPLLNKYTHGFQPGQLVILAGRPGMCKTTLAINLLEKMGHGAFFSLEMPAIEINKRRLAAISGVSHSDIQGGTLGDEDWPKISSAARQMKYQPMQIEEIYSVSVDQIASRIRHLHAQEALSIACIDYLQLIGTSGAENRAIGLAGITRALKTLALELKIPILLLSQLNRSLESRDNKRPRLSDLRESGAIEQDADTVLMIYRDEMYNKTPANAGYTELIISKQRSGEGGNLTVPLHFNGPNYLFRPSEFRDIQNHTPLKTKFKAYGEM